MRKRLIIITLLISVSLLIGPLEGRAETVNEGGVSITVGRVLTGANTGTRYYGYTSGRIALPHTRGGMLSFTLWNDMQTNGTAFTNYFNAQIGGQTVRIANYATRHQVREEYAQFRGAWGAAGVYRYTVAIPPGVAAFDFNNSGSATGIELSNVHFTEGYRPLSGGFDRTLKGKYKEPVIQVGRILNGEKTGQKFYGFTSGMILLPHTNGGFLSFKFYNDQHTGFHTTLNKINLTVGAMKETFTQYTTSLDLIEHYKEFRNVWGPAGGSQISIQIPEGVSRVDFNNSGSQTGIEISQVSFSKGAPIVFDFKERVNRTSATLKNFGRVLHGASSAREFYGFTGGRVALPHNKGGTLSFRMWNDHNANSAQTKNQLNITAGSLRLTERLVTTSADRREFYREFMNQWGPAGGKTVSVTVPAGVSIVDFNNSGSDTGVEISDIVFGGH